MSAYSDKRDAALAAGRGRRVWVRPHHRGSRDLGVANAPYRVVPPAGSGKERAS